jgi:hypothetical protein
MASSRGPGSRLQVDSHPVSLLEEAYTLRRGPVPTSSPPLRFAIGQNLVSTGSLGGTPVSVKNV